MRLVRYIVSLSLLWCFLIIDSASIQAQTWTQEHQLPFGATDASIAFNIGDYIYCGGGGGVKTFYRYDPKTNVWTRKANLPGPGDERAFAVAFSIGDKGYMGTGQQTNAQTNVLNDFWSYDTATDKWTQQASLPGPGRDGAFGFAVAGKGYIGSGADTGGYYLGDFYSYDTATKSWTRLGDLPEQNMFFASTFVIGDSAYLATCSVDNVETPDSYSYDPSSDSWNVIAPFPGANRQAAVGFSIAGKGYVGLGMAQYDTVFSDFFSYDPQTGGWSPAPTFADAALGWSFAAATSSYAFVGGGWNFGPTFANTFWEFAPAGDAAVSITDHAKQGLSIYPNPCNTSTNVSLKAAGSQVKIIMTDLLGRSVYEVNRTTSIGDLIDVNIDATELGLPAGVYQISATTGNAMLTCQLIFLR
jgi:N-acetylneuraminic acid mutarotase